jgi:hypothetical protein
MLDTSRSQLQESSKETKYIYAENVNRRGERRGERT